MEKKNNTKILLLLLVLILIMDTSGYMLIEKASMADAFYMTIISITTVGFREVFPLSSQGRLFTVFVILSGLGLFFSLAVSLVDRAVEGRLRIILGRRKMKALSKLKAHVIVAGFGRMGEQVVQDLVKHGLECVVIEKDPQRFALAEEQGLPVIMADATREDILLQSGIRKAATFISLLSTDADNVFALLTVKELNPDIYIIARALDGNNQNKLFRSGAHRVITPNLLSSKQIVNIVIKPNVVDLMEVLTKPQLMSLTIDEMQVHSGSPFQETAIRNSGFRDRFNALVVAVKKKDRMNFNPPPDLKIEAGDIVILLGPPEQLAEMEKINRQEK